MDGVIFVATNFHGLNQNGTLVWFKILFSLHTSHYNYLGAFWKGLIINVAYLQDIEFQLPTVQKLWQGSIKQTDTETDKSTK